MRTLQIAVIAMLTVTGAIANGITITLDTPNQTGHPGDTLSFFGTITNTDPVSGNAPVYFNLDSLNLTLSDASLNDQFYAAWFPLSLAPGATSGDIELFGVTFANPETQTYGVYTGSYGLQGGQDGGDQSATGSLVNADFTVNVEAAPEPGTSLLIGSGLVFLPLFARHRMRSRS